MGEWTTSGSHMYDSLLIEMNWSTRVVVVISPNSHGFPKKVPEFFGYPKPSFQWLWTTVAHTTSQLHIHGKLFSFSSVDGKFFIWTIISNRLHDPILIDTHACYFDVEYWIIKRKHLNRVQMHVTLTWTIES